MKKKISIFLALLLLFTGVLVPIKAKAAEDGAIFKAMKDTQKNQYSLIKEPTFGTLAGEWTVFGLARSDASVPSGYYDSYYKRIEDTVKSMKGNLHKSKFTEYSRLIVALTSIGKDPRNVGGYDLVKPLSNFNDVIKQGINGPIWALIALDTRGFEIDNINNPSSQNSRDKMIDYILSLEITDANGKKGGWALTGNTPDPDITAMALYSFRPYLSEKKVKDAVDRGLQVLSDLQNSSGGYTSWGTENSESTAQVIMALTAFGIHPEKDARFIKYDKNLNKASTLDALLSFYDGKGSFKHVSDQKVDAMATDQALEALAAYYRFVNGKSYLFDMKDLTINNSQENKNLPFTDINEHWAKGNILATSGYNISNGNKAFQPDKAITRGEFAYALVKAFKLENKDIVSSFSDVKNNAWYKTQIEIAASNKIIEGVGNGEFQPDRTITRQEAMTMMYRVLSLKGFNKNLEDVNQNIIKNFPDYVNVSDWARSYVAFNIENKIIQGRDKEITPLGNITRAESVVVIQRSVGLVK